MTFMLMLALVFALYAEHTILEAVNSVSSNTGNTANTFVFETLLVIFLMALLL